MNMNNLAIALDARSKGIVAIPCRPGTKVPAIGWKKWQSAIPPMELQRHWFRDPCNIAIITTGFVVFDCDDPAKAELVIEKCGATPHKLRTPRGGIHLGYRRRQNVAVTNQVKIKGMDIDIRTDGGLELIPMSETECGRYEWLGPGLHSLSDLPVAKVGWTRDHRQRTIRLLDPIADASQAVRRARAYLATIEGAVSGQRGHDRTMRVAGILVQKFGLSIADALPIILDWNQKCQPPWNEKELLHKLQDALRLRCHSER